MYLGNRSHHGAGRASSYADAQRILERQSFTPTGRSRAPTSCGYPLGLTKRGNTRVYQRSDGGIAFRLYSTDVVTYLPDDTIEIENYATVTTSGFAHQFLPSGFHLHHPSRDGGHNGIGYTAVDGVRCIAFGAYGSGCISFKPLGSGYAPTDAAQIKFPRVDTQLARAATRGLPWKDFENWLSMAPRHLDIEHATFDLDMCVDALKARDFRTAAEHLPVIDPPSGFGIEEIVRRAAYPIDVRGGCYVTPGSIGKLKLAIYEDSGALVEEVFDTLDYKTFDNRMTLLRKLESIDVSTSGWGPQ